MSQPLEISHISSHGQLLPKANRSAELSVDAWQLAESVVQNPSQIKGLHKAAFQGDTGLLMKIVKEEGLEHINQQDQFGISPIHYATLSNNLTCIERIQQLGAKKECKDFYGRTAVHYASYFDKLKSLRFLILSKSAWNPEDHFNRTALHWSCSTKSTKCLEFLLRHAESLKEEKEPTDEEGTTPLFVAAQYCQSDIISVLSDAGYNFLKTDVEGKTALHWTLNNPNTSCLKALVQHQPALLNNSDGNTLTLLHMASYSNITHITEELLKYSGLLVDCRDANNLTPLHYTCIGGYDRLTKALLEKKALDTCLDNDGLSALHYAVENKRIDCISVFIALPMISHLPDREFRTPLMYASYLGMASLVKELLKHVEVRRQINGQDNQENTSLLISLLAANSIETIKLLLEVGANPNIMNSSGIAALHYCCQTDNSRVATMLIENRADCTILDKVDKLSPLMMAIKFGSPQVLRILINYMEDVTTSNYGGLTVLHFAAQLGRCDHIEIILTSPHGQALLHTRDPNGLTPLYYSVTGGNADATKLLLHNGSEINERLLNFDGDTVLDFAIKSKQTIIIKDLKSYQAMTQHEILTIAAIEIQKNVRRLLSQNAFKKLLLYSKASTVISLYYKRYRIRLESLDMKLRYKSATKIQSLFRGFSQRQRVKSELITFREERNCQELKNTYLKIYANDIFKKSIKNITIESLDFNGMLYSNPWRKTLIEKQNMTVETREVSETKEQRLRLENSLRLRVIIERVHESREVFLSDERQRKEKSKLNTKFSENLKIVEASIERRFSRKRSYAQTVAVKSKSNAAIAIQRRIRIWLEDQRTKKETILLKYSRQKSRESAARLIQKNWRLCLRKLRQTELNNTTQIIENSMQYPLTVISSELKARPPQGYSHNKSYEDKTLIRGNPKRKLLMPPTRNVLLDARNDFLSMSLPENNVLEITKIIRTTKPPKSNHRSLTVNSMFNLPTIEDKIAKNRKSLVSLQEELFEASSRSDIFSLSASTAQFILTSNERCTKMIASQNKNRSSTQPNKSERRHSVRILDPNESFPSLPIASGKVARISVNDIKSKIETLPPIM